MNKRWAGVRRVAMAAAIALVPSSSASEETGAPSTHYDCLFQPLVGGQLTDGALITPDSGQFAHLPVAIGFTVEDASAEAATMRFGKSPDRSVPARLEVRDQVVRFSYEFPGLSAGSVTISRTATVSGFPAVRSDQGWYDGVLSVGYSAGLCQAGAG